MLCQRRLCFVLHANQLDPAHLVMLPVVTDGPLWVLEAVFGGRLLSTVLLSTVGLNTNNPRCSEL